MRFTTENSSYRIEDNHLIREYSSHGLRRDHEPIRILETLSPPIIGHPARFLLDLVGDDKTTTLRTTSHVLTIKD